MFALNPTPLLLPAAAGARPTFLRSGWVSTRRAASWRASTLTTARIPRSCPLTTTSECSIADASADIGHCRDAANCAAARSAARLSWLPAVGLARVGAPALGCQHCATQGCCTQLFGTPAVRPAVLSSIVCFPAIEPGVDATVILSFRQLQMKLGTQQKKDCSSHSSSAQWGWGCCGTKPF